MTPFDSSMLAAKDVFLIISLKLSLFSEIFLFSKTVPISGNSSAGIPTILNSLREVRMDTLLWSARAISIDSEGNFLTISVNNFAGSTTAPGSKSETSIFFSILRSMSEAVIVSVPVSSMDKRIPFRTGIVLLTVTAFETKARALFNSC